MGNAWLTYVSAGLLHCLAHQELVPHSLCREGDPKQINPRESQMTENRTGFWTQVNYKHFFRLTGSYPSDWQTVYGSEFSSYLFAAVKCTKSLSLWVT